MCCFGGCIDIVLVVVDLCLDLVICEVMCVGWFILLLVCEFVLFEILLEWFGVIVLCV